MEEDFRKLLERNRSKFRAAVAAERLLSPLAVSHALSSEELQSIQNEIPTKRLDKLLDVLQRRDYNSFKRFCVVLETTYPYMLNCMFLSVEPPASATARLEKAKVAEKEFDGKTSRIIQCGSRHINIGRSTSMTGHDLCKDRYSLLKNELKAVKWDLEQAKSELQRTEKERDTACHQLAEFSGQKCVENIEWQKNASNCHSTSSERNDYERLKHEYVNVLTELQILRQQNADIGEKHNIATQEADYFRKQHKTVLNKCDMLVREAQGLHHKLEESLRDREKIKQDYEEIVLLREREKFEMKDGNIELMLDRHEPTDSTFAVEKYEQLQDYEQLQETHRQLRLEYNHIFNRLKPIEMDYGSLKEQFDCVIRERDSLMVDYNGLKQQCEAAIKNVDKSLKDQDNAVKNQQQSQQERDAALKDCDKIMNLQIKTARELSKVTEERNAVVNEYKLVMSERDNVHRETEKVQDRLNMLQSNNEYLMEEKEKLHNHNNALQDEVNIFLAENDNFLGEVYLLKEKSNSLLIENKNILMERDRAVDEYEMLKQERDAARKERSEAIIHRDKILKECFKVKQKQDLLSKGEGKEIDSLRKQFQILSKELTNALHEADVAKQRCDWALLERDKAIHEHSRLHNSHKQLQNEHNRVINEMTEMLHDSDQIRAQHSEIMMEMIDLKHRIESQLHENSKGSERELLSSRDSAIDTDSMEWETESIVLEKINHDKDIGIIIGGGRDTPLLPNDSSIVVTDITKGSVADGKLKVNDCLLKVNNLDLTNVEHKIAVQAITESSVINLTVRRRRSLSVKSLTHPVRLTLADGNELGIHVDDAKVIQFLSPGSVAAQHPMLSVGDRILSINGLSVENLSQEETEKLLSTSTVSLAVQKPKATTPTHALHSLLEEVTNKINYESDVYQHVQSHRRKILLTDGCSDVFDHSPRQGLFYSGRSSPSNEGPASSPDSVSEPALHNSSSLGPFYESGTEKTQATQTDSSDASIDAISETHLAEPNTSSSQVGPETSRPSVQETTSHNLHAFERQNTSRERPLPRARTCSYTTALRSSTTTVPLRVNSYDTRYYVTEGALPSPLPITSTVGHYPPMTEEYHCEHTHANASLRPRGTRPQSAPSSRHQYLPYTSHLDPLALTIPKVYPSGPPASVAVLKSRTVPFYTATSYVIPRYNAQPAQTQHCMPVSCWNDMPGSSNGSPVSRGHGGLILDQCLPIQHTRQGSSHSADENDFRRRHLYQQSFDSSTYGNKHKLLNRMSLPGYCFNSQPCFSSGVTGSSAGSAGSLSSGQVTPLRTPSTPIVPVMEGEILAFDFSGHGPTNSTTDNRDPESRLVHIEKKDTLGISIAPGNNVGIFVCSVGAGSVAEKAGLKYGDQLLEYNGVNLRCANYEQAAKILKESGNSVTILAQFNPQRALEGDFDIGTSSMSESSTACSTPVNKRKLKRDDSTITPPLPKDEKVVPMSDVEIPGDVRYVYINHTSTNLGFNITGGNASGIFVSEVDANSEVAKELSVGDQILEYDGCDMLSCTAEQALLELCKPTPGSVQALVQYNPAKFNTIKDQPGDSFYVRCLYDHTSNSKEELAFKKGDILYITDTMYQGYIGCWKACLVSAEDAQKRENGIVPSRTKAEQEILLYRSLALAHADDHKLSGRRSLFRRSKKSSHSLAISHSREGSDSAASITTMSSDLGVVSYQTVEKLDSHIPRVVILFGPLAEVFCEKLASDFPYKFVYCKSEYISLSEEKVDKSISEGTFVDYSWKGEQLTCTTLSSIKKVTDKHSLLVVSPQAIERLNTLQVYPIVLFIKFKSYKQIKELRDHKYIQEKMTSKDAREMFESAQRLEKEHKPIFNGVVHGHSVGSICTAIQEAAAEQQKKTIWVPLTSV